MRVVSYPEADVPRELRRQMMALQEQAWPSGQPLDPAPWHDPSLDPISLLLLDDGGSVLSALDILSKDVTLAGETYAASGISAMVTDEGVRGQGHGRALARVARETMASNGVDLGIFTCDSHLKRFYERAGWEHLPGTVLVGGTREEPFPSDQFDKVTLAALFSERARAAKMDFVRARIELYSGAIDKLW